VSTLVFVHGTRLTGGMWAAQRSALEPTFRTVAVDLPGHGRLADETFTLDRAADVVDEAIGDRPGDKAVVIGLSLGGYVAMALAARRPERVLGLVLSGATAEPVGLRALPFRGLARLMDASQGPTLDRIQAGFFRRRYPPTIADPIIAGGFWTQAGATALRAIAGRRFLPLLAAYPGPTLILNGERDFVFRPGAGAFAAAACDGHRVRLAGATHLANLDRPGAFNEAIRRFVGPL
jgi:pimeloyl-ACP methyl ester carboxylesterase